jgi:prophage regulatory protein
MTDTVLRLPEVKVRVGLSRSTIYQAIQRQEFPSPIPIGARAVGWLESEIAEWLTGRIAQRGGKQ